LRNVLGLKHVRAFLHELAKAGQDELTVLRSPFVCEVAQRIEEYSSGSFVGLGSFGKCALKFGLGRL
jgi:hypothetical protein